MQVCPFIHSSIHPSPGWARLRRLVPPCAIATMRTAPSVRLLESFTARLPSMLYFHSPGSSGRFCRAILAGLFCLSAGVRAGELNNDTSPTFQYRSVRTRRDVTRTCSGLINPCIATGPSRAHNRLHYSTTGTRGARLSFPGPLPEPRRRTSYLRQLWQSSILPSRRGRTEDYACTASMYLPRARPPVLVRRRPASRVCARAWHHHGSELSGGQGGP